MEVIIVRLDSIRSEEVLPSDDEGCNVRASEAAVAIVDEKLGTVEGIVWHLPNVFDVRYGSNYMATATVGERSVRFLSTLGKWKEDDDK